MGVKEDFEFNAQVNGEPVQSAREGGRVWVGGWGGAHVYALSSGPGQRCFGAYWSLDWSL